MGRMLRDPIWQFLGTLYTIIGLLSVIPPIRDFFFQSNVYVGLYIAILSCPLALSLLIFEQARTWTNQKIQMGWRLLRQRLIPAIRKYWRIELVAIFLFLTVVLWRGSLDNPVVLSLIAVYTYLFIIAFDDSQRRSTSISPWTYDFYDHYAESIAFKMPEYQFHKLGTCGGQSKRSLLAQPPLNGSGWYLYKVSVPNSIKKLELAVWIGIADGAQIRPRSTIRYEVHVDGSVIFAKEYGEKQWQYQKLSLDRANATVIDISFITSNTGSDPGYGALWGEPILTEVR